MEKKKVYIVSFGNSDKYRYEYTMPASADELHKPNPFADIEKRLTNHLLAHAPIAHDLAYYTSAKATEVHDAARYASYPPLDENAIKTIEKVLLTEVCNQLANEKEDLNAPFAEVKP